MTEPKNSVRQNAGRRDKTPFAEASSPKQKQERKLVSRTLAGEMLPPFTRGLPTTFFIMLAPASRRGQQVQGEGVLRLISRSLRRPRRS